MLSFATELPFPAGTTHATFLAALKTWLCGSRHTRFTAAALAGLGLGEAWDAAEDAETIESLCESAPDSDHVAVIYRKMAPDVEWTSTIVLVTNAASSWISIKIECDPLHPRARTPVPKKPVLLRVLIDELGGGGDGDFSVGNTPVMFTRSELDLAARCVRGETGSYMPVVYVSAPFHGRYPVDPNVLADALAGMAHVVVEPNRDFSLALMAATHRNNVYGGAIGLYWPEGGGARRLFAADLGANALAAIVEEVRLSLINRRPLVRCTLAAVKELKSRRLINSLKDEGSKEAQGYVDLYEEELASRREALQAAEEEIFRLKAEVRRHGGHEVAGDGILLDTGDECDLYEGELRETVRDALESSISRVADNGRRQHILKAIVAANPIAEEKLRTRERIKGILRGYQSMDSKTRRELEQIGFSVTEDGKHCKLVYQDDARYTFILSKTGSDHRGGLNAAADICRSLF